MAKSTLAPASLLPWPMPIPSCSHRMPYALHRPLPHVVNLQWPYSKKAVIGGEVHSPEECWSCAV